MRQLSLESILIQVSMVLDTKKCKKLFFNLAKNQIIQKQNESLSKENKENVIKLHKLERINKLLEVENTTLKKKLAKESESWSHRLIDTKEQYYNLLEKKITETLREEEIKTKEK